MQRLQRTGLAAMVTVYGARSVAEQMIARVVRRHGQVNGHTPGGEPYSANNVDLLTWVQATAGYGFAQAFHAYVRPLGRDEFDRLYLEGAPAARLYGALGAPGSDDEMQRLFDSMRSRLEPSPIVFEFLKIMGEAPILPAPLRPLQRLLVRAAVEIAPAWVRERLQLTGAHGLGAIGQRLVRWPAGSPSAWCCARARRRRLAAGSGCRPTTSTGNNRRWLDRAARRVEQTGARRWPLARCAQWPARRGSNPRQPA